MTSYISPDGDRPRKPLNPKLPELGVVADRPFANLTWEDVAERLPFEADGEPRATEPAEAARELRAAIEEVRAAKEELVGATEAVRGDALDELLRSGVLTALGKEGLLRYADFLAAAGISREVGDRLRERGELDVVVVDNESKNPTLYVTVGHARAFVRSRTVAPAPSKSKLSKAKRTAKNKRRS